MTNAIWAQSAAGLVAVGDRASTALVVAAVSLLVVVGLGLIVMAIWLWRVTRVDDPVLLPLERMGERSWRRADPVFQRRMLDEVRPEGAIALHHMAPVPEPDPQFDLGPDPAGVADLVEVEATEVSGASGASDVPVADRGTGTGQRESSASPASTAEGSAGDLGLRPPQ